MRNPKRPRNQNQFAKNIVDPATGEKGEIIVVDNKNLHAVALGR